MSVIETLQKALEHVLLPMRVKHFLESGKRLVFLRDLMMSSAQVWLASWKTKLPNF